MNPWFAVLLGIIIGAILLEGAVRFKKRRGKRLSEFDIFDELDYNRIVMPCNHYSEKYYEYCILDSDHNSQAVNAPIFHQGTKYMWLQTAVDLPADVNLISDEEFQFERNARQYQAEAKLTVGVTREARGYGIMAGQCNNLNMDESYPYYCVRHISHIHHVDPKVRRHGYAGVFWD